MSAGEDMLAVLSTADCLCTERQVNAAYDALASDLARDYAQLDPLVLIVMTGGFVPAAELIKRLRFPLDVDYLHATRYQGAIHGADLVWKRRPEAALVGRHILVVDDILDEGETLASVRRMLLAQDPASVRVVVLADKRHGRRRAATAADYVGLELPDRYVFGCGMDYRGYWRQLPAIYAVAEL